MIPVISIVLLVVVLALTAWAVFRPARASENGDRLERILRAEMAQNRKENAETAKENRAEVSAALKSFNDSMLQRFDALLNSSEKKIESMRQTVEKQMQGMQQSNETKLDQMRHTVEEKLHDTLEKRFGQSFMMVSQQLDKVHKGLGEMQALATGVGDLKKVLSNVKTRGVFGELQLQNLIEERLTSDQYGKNVATKIGETERVEFAIKFPGDGETPVWLPVDSKFPNEFYDRYIDACERSDDAGIEETRKELAARIRDEAKKIRQKYIDPPNTTEYAVLFLPFESLFADIVKMGLLETLQREYQVTICGPTTFHALLTSLQMGFRNITIQKRSAEVWQLLGLVKTEFGKFGDLLDKTRRKLEEATNTIDDASRKTRTIERKLRDVQQPSLPPQEGLLGEGSEAAAEAENIV